jgi:50S ribosomal protein L16 3-hydroxylase
LPGALPGFHSSLDGDELAGLACEEDVESRLITYSATEWSVRHGPFDQEDFDKLPESGWTLLVQDVEKHLPELASVLTHFDFLPRWRLDDLMISYAVSGGTVGPHLDAYDVFLIQGQGRRSWSVDPAPDDLSVFPDLELKVLKNFASKKKWQLELGDILYLPPGVAHHGISDIPGITLSVGFRAPAARDLLRTMANMLEEDDRTRRYGDQDLDLQEVAGSMISAAAVGRASTVVALASERVAECLGRNVTEVKPWLRPDPSTTDETAIDVLDKLRHGDSLRRHSMSRYAWSKDQNNVCLFVDGESWRFELDCEGFAVALCEATGIGLAQLSTWLECEIVISALRDIIRQGSLLWENEANEDNAN